MIVKQVFSHYRKAVYIFLAVLSCIFFCIILLYYTKADREGIEVYDLTWPDKTDVNCPVFRRWRYFIETETNLPRKVEKYYKLAPEEDYILEETLVISYPSAEEIKSAIEDAGF